jgi:hypothetical protein
MQVSKLRFICTRKWVNESRGHDYTIGYSQNWLLVSKDYHHAGRWNAGFYVHHFVKDLGIALHECQQMGISLPGLALVSPLPCYQSIGIIISVYWRICSREWACYCWFCLPIEILGEPIWEPESAVAYLSHWHQREGVHTNCGLDWTSEMATQTD